MATRQYIGARYVPKFYTNSVDGSATWESNVVYEPLTYVTLTNSHMYISKKEVPATVGTPASNIQYWLDVGSYNGFIDDLQNQINALSANKGDKVAIGTVETLGSAPSRTYYGGEVFLGNDGKEYVITETSVVPPTVLDNGASGNCVQASINSELNKLNTVTIPAINSSISNLEDAVDDLKDAVGTVETLGSAPSRTYYEGEVFLGDDGKEYVITDASVVPPAVLNNGAGGNCEPTTINSEFNKLNNIIPTLESDIGDMSDLTTESTTDLVSAINSVDNIIKGAFVTPEMFGAVGDGVTDDTQAVIDALATGKMVVCNGTYLITSTITLANGACIVGGEAYKYRVTFKTTNGGFTVSGSTRHVTLKGIYAVSTGSGETFFLYPSANADRHYNFEDVRIDGYAVGFDIKGTLWDSTFTRVRIHNTVSTDYAVKFAAANSFNIKFDQCYFDGGKVDISGLNATFICCNLSLMYINQYTFTNCCITWFGCNLECDQHISSSGVIVKLPGGEHVFLGCSFYNDGESGTVLLDPSSATRLLKVIGPSISNKVNNNGMYWYRQDYLEVAYPGCFQLDGAQTGARYTGYSSGYLPFSPLLPSTVIQSTTDVVCPRSTIRYNISLGKLQFTNDGTTWKNIQFET